MNRYFIVVITISFALGIFLDNLLNVYFRFSFLIFASLAVGFVLLFYKFKNIRSIICVALIITSGFTYHHYRSYPTSQNSIENLISEDRTLTKIKGIIIRPLVVKSRFNQFPTGLSRVAKENKSIIFLIRAEAVKIKNKWVPISGIVRGTIYLNYFHKSKDNTYLSLQHQDLQYGDKIEITGNIFSPRPPTNPGQFDYKKYLCRSEPPIRALISVADPSNVKLLSRNNESLIFRYIFSLRKKFLNTIYSVTGQSKPSILTSLLLGEREDVQPQVMDAFIKSGTIHFLAISGLHVGILVVVANLIFLILSVNTKVSGYIIIVLVIVYAILTGMKPPVLRATIMVVVYYVAIILNRRWNTPCGIAAAAMFILIRNPSELFNAGFQLSFLSITGILLMAHRIEPYLQRTPGLEERLCNSLSTKILHFFEIYCAKTLSVSIAAWLAVAPVSAFYFHIIAPLSIPLNIVIFPLIWLALVSGFIFMTVGSIFLFLAVPFAWIATIADYIIIKIISFSTISHVTFFYTCSLTAAWLVLYYILGMVLINSERLKLRRSRVIIIVLLTGSVYFFSNLIDSEKDQLRLTCLDVGHGSAVFIEFPNGKNLLFDCGSFSNYDIGKWIVAPFLWKQRIKKIDTVVISHQDTDHCNGLPSIMERFKIGTLLTTKRCSISATGNKLLQSAKTNGIKTGMISAGDEVTGYENTKIAVLNPPNDPAIASLLSVNDASSVLKINCFGYVVLLCADIEEDGINRLVLYYKNNINSDIIIVPHHGRHSNNSNILADHVKPEYAVISAKDQGPSESTIEAYKNAKILQTGRSGAITVTIKETGINVAPFY